MFCVDVSEFKQYVYTRVHVNIVQEVGALFWFLI